LICFQDLLSRLQQARPQLETDIATGRSLAQQQEAPEFVGEALHALEETLKETEALAQEKYSTLQVNLIIKYVFMNSAVYLAVCDPWSEIGQLRSS
jgi:uncharacterized membrane protein